MKVLGQSVVAPVGAVVVFEVSPETVVAVSLAARSVSAELPVGLLPLSPVELSSDDRLLAEHLVREVAYGRVDHLDVVPDGSDTVPEPPEDLFESVDAAFPKAVPKRHRRR